MHRKYEYFDDEKRIFGQTIWQLHSFFRNLNTKRLISPEYLVYIGNIYALWVTYIDIFKIWSK